jgi:lysophospholipase L1-like esterase
VKVLVWLCLLAALAAPAALSAAPLVLKDMESTQQFPPHEFDRDGQKLMPGTVQLVPGRVGQALQFSFVAEARSGFFLTNLQPTPAWDKAAGLSFWVKGDGSESWGGIELIDADFRGRYAACFPISSTEWRKMEIPWSDLIPETATAPFLDPAQGGKPSVLRYLAFGKWHYWRDYPAATFAIDQLALEPTLRVDHHDYTPRRPGAPSALAKLKAKQPITIVTLGDSLSDKHHWANREVLWSEVLVQNLERRYGSKVTLVNPAIGGAELTYGLIYAPRWLAHTPAPDLITIWSGYNDVSDGSTPQLYAERLRFAVDYLRRLTHGRSEIVLLTTCPAVGRWTELEGLAQAARDVAHEKRTGLADIAAAFHRAGDANEAARKGLYCSDEVHLGAAGHRLVAETVTQALARTP